MGDSNSDGRKAEKEAVENTKAWKAAEKKYWRDLSKLLRIFSAARKKVEKSCFGQ